MSHVVEWAKYFAVTALVELAIALPLLGGGERRARRFLAVTFAQLVSHPSVWFIVLALGLPRLLDLIVAETWAILSELLLYRLVFERLSWWRALGVSAVANGGSLAVGTWLG
jgi:hypothetical protein